MKCLLMMMAAAMLAGCGAQTRTYELSVENRTNHEVTLCLTKDGPPAEDGWKSPEQLAIEVQTKQIKYDLAYVPAGKTAYTGAMKGHFKSGTHGVLRVYDGSPDLSALMGEKVGERERVDYVLSPGKSKLAVVDQGGKLAVTKD